jgi:hypothetical protein
VEICLDGGFPKVSKKTKCRKWIEIVAHRGEIIRNTTSPEERQVLLNSLYGIDRRKKYKLNNALINRALPRMAKTEEDSANTNRDNNSPQPE